MDQIAIISDIHGNMPALEAVFDEISRRNIDRIMCLGDIIGKGPSPDSAIDFCREKCERIIKGNHEEFICSDITYGGETFEKMKEWHKNKIGKERYDYLLTLGNSIDIKMSGKNIRLFHASQISTTNRVRKSDDIEKHLSMFENTEFTGYLHKPQVVGYGDIHNSYTELINGKILFNVGSVGNPLGIDTRASFGIISGQCNSSAEDKLGLEIVKVEYDKNRAIYEAKNCGLLGIEFYINEILTGKYRDADK
jgi:protein phosphatase